MTTRQYHRNSMLAFPKTAEYANPCEGFEGRAYGRAWWAVMAVIAVFTAVAVWAGR